VVNEMSRQDLIELEGKITKKINGGKYIVKVENEEGKELEITAHPTGKIRLNNVTLTVGDTVCVSVSPYDLTKGTITWRNRK